MPRLFTGLEVPAEIGQTLSNLRGGLPGARWIDPENYHVTLRFIGDIDGMSANEIASMLFRINRKPFEVKLQGLHSFGGRKPRAVVAAVEPSRPLIELQAELERMMQRMGLDPEGRKFTPHVTLARLHDASSQDVADYLSVRGYFPSRTFMASRFVLFSSRASTGGGPYVVEAPYALSACGTSYLAPLAGRGRRALRAAGEGVQVCQLASALADRAPHPNPLPVRTGRGRRKRIPPPPIHSLQFS
jgi:RNA 2',3'-cyclic 3'-phosphodiesterase